MKRLISIILILCTIFSLSICVQAASTEMKDSADRLNELGLFSGVGTDKNGKPIYDLDRAPTRAEAITMLVRLLGKETEAKEAALSTPFTDVPDWAKPYVGYAYNNKLTLGLNATTFGSSAKVSASQYITFVLRALGYDSGTDFKWDAAWELSDKIGLTDGSYSASSNNFLRGDVAIISNNSLDVCQKDSQKTLGQTLVDNGAISDSAYNKVPAPNLNLFSFVQNSEGYTITEYKTSLEPADMECIAIPSEYNGKPVTRIEAFFYSHAKSISIPDTITFITLDSFENIENCRKFIVDRNNPNFCSVDGILMSKDEKTLIRYPSSRPGLVYTIPSTVTTISRQAFRCISTNQQNNTLETLVIPASVTYVDYLAFNLSNITLDIQGDASNWNRNCFAWSNVALKTNNNPQYSSFRLTPDSNNEFNVSQDYAEYAYIGNGISTIRIGVTFSTVPANLMIFEAGKDDDNDAQFCSLFGINSGSNDVVMYIPSDAFNNIETFVFRIRDISKMSDAYFRLDK